MYDIVIIGSGPAGLSAAIYAQRENLKAVVVEKEFMGTGQIAATQPTAATQATTQATTQAADSSADTGDGYTGNYTWDDGTYSGGDTGYYNNNSYNNYDNGTYDNGNADGAYTGE